MLQHSEKPCPIKLQILSLELQGSICILNSFEILSLEVFALHIGKCIWGTSFFQT